METEQRLIDANKVARDVRENNKENFFQADWSSKRVCELLESAPTVDAVEVVRCKDCKNYVKMSEQDKEFRCNVFCGCYDRPYPTGPNDFCSYGERRAT